MTVMKKDQKTKRAFLHNDITVDIRDATVAQLKNSIVWYNKTIEKYLKDKTCAGFVLNMKNNLAYIRAEMAGRIGKK